MNARDHTATRSTRTDATDRERPAQHKGQQTRTAILEAALMSSARIPTSGRAIRMAVMAES